MSVIVAVEKGNRIAIAADSLHTAGSLKVPPHHKVNHKKLFKWGPSWMGLIGWGALSTIAESVIRENPDAMNDPSRIGVFDTLRALHPILRDEYYLETHEDKSQPVESSQLDGLMISPVGIIGFSSYRNVSEYARFWAIGAARDYALGAMHSVYDRLRDPAAIAKAGVVAAIEFDDSCGAPIDVHTMTKKKA
ncbi:MAG: MFS transporter [Verrucomicrobiota bacterium]